MNMNTREVVRAAVSLNQNQGYLNIYFILCVCRGRDKEPIEIWLFTSSSYSFPTVKK